MSVNNYDKLCKYSIGNLDNTIYLYDYANTKISYKIDEEYQENGIAESIIGSYQKMYCDKVSFTTETSSDNRYAFKHKLTIQLLEQENNSNVNIIDKLFSNKYIVVFKDKEGNKWIMNPEFPITINYIYNITDTNNNIASIDLITESNIPTLLLIGNVNDNVPSIRDKQCQYNAAKAITLELASIYDVFFSTNKITEKGLNKIKSIDYNKNSLSFKEEYNGDTFKQTLTFNIPFSNYKYYFHIDLLEYIENKYYAIIKTNNNNLVIGGYRQGMFPEFTVNTNDDNNIITITMSAVYQHYSLLSYNNDTLIKETIDDITYNKIDGECIDGIYTYTLLRKVVNDNITNEYYCAEGYQDDYSSYNIVGVYDINSSEYGRIRDYSIKCESTCDIQGLPSTIIFGKIGDTKEYTIVSDCTIELDFDLNECDASYVDNVLKVTNKIEKGDYIIYVRLQDGTNLTINCIVDETLIYDKTINITAKSQNVDIRLSKSLDEIKRIDTTLNYSPNQSGNGYVVRVSENESLTTKRTFEFKVVYNDSTSETIYIIQDHLYSIKINDGTKQCFGNDKWEMWLNRVGYTPDNITIDKGYEKGQLYEKDSIDCLDYDTTKNIGTICVLKILNNIIEYYKGNTLLTTKLTPTNEACDDSTTQYEYRINRDRSICHNGVSYYAEELYASNDGVNWYLVVPIVDRTSSEVSTSNICDVVNPRDKNSKFRWYDKGETLCLDENVNINCKKNEVVEPIDGDTSTFLCEGFSKYKMIKKYISPFCDYNFDYIGYEKGELINKKSLECGYICRNDDLAFEFNIDNIDSLFNINDITYTAYTTPYIVDTRKDLGIDKITSFSYLFSSSNVTNVIHIPYAPYVTNMECMFRNCDKLMSLDLKKLQTSNVANMGSMFMNCSSLPSLDLSNFNTSKVENMSNMFEYCYNLTSLDLSNFNTSNVTDMHSMFGGCESLTSLDLSNFNTSSCTNLIGMFSGCKLLKELDVNHFDITKNKYIDGIFDGCLELTSLDLSNWDTTNLLSISEAFDNCNSLTSLNISNWNTSNVIDLVFAFSHCNSLKTLDISNWNISRAQDMEGIFKGCTSLENIDLSKWKVSKVKYFDQAFENCASLKNLDLSKWKTTNMLGLSSMFKGCSSLTSLDLSNFNTYQINNTNNLFDGCTSLTTLNLSNWNLYNISEWKLMFNNCTSLTSIIMDNRPCYDIDVIISALTEAGIRDNVTIYSNRGCEGTVPHA